MHDVICPKKYNLWRRSAAISLLLAVSRSFPAVSDDVGRTDRERDDVGRQAGVPREQFPRSILMTSSPTRPTSSRGCYTRMSGVSGDFPVKLATRLADWTAGGLLRCSAARLSVCRVVLQVSRARHSRLGRSTTCCGQVYSILVR